MIARQAPEEVGTRDIGQPGAQFRLHGTANRGTISYPASTGVKRMIKHVLVPIDGSELAGKSVAHAVALAKALKAKVTAFHAYPEYRAVLLYEYVGPVNAMSRRDYVAAAKETAEGYLAKVTKAARAAGLEADGVAVASDYPHEAIIRTAKKEGLRSDHHGLAWSPRCIGSAARERDAKGVDAFEDPGARRALSRRSSDRVPVNAGKT